MNAPVLSTCPRPLSAPPHVDTELGHVTRSAKFLQVAALKILAHGTPPAAFQNLPLPCLQLKAACWVGKGHRAQARLPPQPTLVNACQRSS